MKATGGKIFVDAARLSEQIPADERAPAQNDQAAATANAGRRCGNPSGESLPFKSSVTRAEAQSAFVEAVPSPGRRVRRGAPSTNWFTIILMNLLQQLQGAVESATTNLRSKRAAAERDAAAAAAEAGELQALAQRYQELFANVEAANVRAANCIAAFESYTEGARAAALSNLVVGWEAGNWPSSLADLARATAAETNREAIVAAFHQRAALYEAQLTEFLDKHRPALQRLGVL